MSRSPHREIESGTEITFRRLFDAAIFEAEKSYRLLPEEEQRQVTEEMQKRRAERKAAHPHSNRCEDTESLTAYAVKCRACQRFKAHHLWPCPKLDLSKFEWMESVKGGENLVPSSAQRKYYSAPAVQRESWQREPLTKMRRFFGEEISVQYEYEEVGR